MWDWLTGRASRDALARIEADRLRLEELDRQQEPMRALFPAILKLMETAELAGNRPTRLLLPPSEMAAVMDGGAALAEVFGYPAPAPGDGFMLFGLVIHPGEKMEVA